MRELKQLIKDLAVEQVQLKSERKTGPLPKFPRTSWGDVSWSDIPTAQRVKLKESFRAANMAQRRKPKITAALNLYHELRGSDYRHGLPDDSEYYRLYKIALRELREEYCGQGTP